MSASRALSVLSLGWAVALSVGCVGTNGTEPDAGPPPPSCTTSDEPTVALGQTDLGYVPFDDFATLRTWERPQGGLGTRLNLGLFGVSPDEDFNRVSVVFNRIPPAGASAGEEGGACMTPMPCDDVDAGPDCMTPECGENLTCIDDVCLLQITDQGSVNFPKECVEDQVMVVPEWPIRFFASTGLELNDYEGMEVNVIANVESDTLPELTVSQPLTLEVGDFIPPSWWSE